MLKKNVALLSKNVKPAILAKNTFPAVSVLSTFCVHLTERASGLCLSTHLKLLVKVDNKHLTAKTERMPTLKVYFK